MSYEKPEQGEWFRVTRKPSFLACCDCGLVHKIELRVDAAGVIEMRAFRDERKTAALRRERRKAGRPHRHRVRG